MVELISMWIRAHPLEFVGGLVGLAVAISLVLIPRLHELPSREHPRC